MLGGGGGGGGIASTFSLGRGRGVTSEFHQQTCGLCTLPTNSAHYQLTQVFTDRLYALYQPTLRITD